MARQPSTTSSFDGRCHQGAHFPMPLPVLCVFAGRAGTLHAQALVRSTLALSAQADVTFVGIGELGIDGPLCVDGFPRQGRDDAELMKDGAAARSAAGFSMPNGKLLDNPINERVASVRSLARFVDGDRDRQRGARSSGRSVLRSKAESDQRSDHG
jgi:DNA-binding transcriptional regulator LsrR (DeoR family)